MGFSLVVFNCIRISRESIAPTVSHVRVMTSQVCTRDTMISMAVMIERTCIDLAHQQKDSSGALKWGKQAPIAVLPAPQPDCRKARVWELDWCLRAIAENTSRSVHSGRVATESL